MIGLQETFIKRWGLIETQKRGKRGKEVNERKDGERVRRTEEI